MRKLVLDFETASACNLKEAGAWRYSEDITTDVISLSWCIDNNPIRTWFPGGETPDIHITAFARQVDVIFVAHNTGFEKAIWRNIMVANYGWPDVPNERWEDTAATCAMKAIPINLDKATLALRLQAHKDKEGSRITKSLSKPNKKGAYNRDPAILQRVYEYNRQDVRATKELLDRIGSLPPEERRVWLLDQTINERGVGLDMAFVEAAEKIVDQASIPLLKEFTEITGGLKPSQTAKFKAWINSCGVVIESLNKEVVAALLGEEDEDDEFGTDDSRLDVPDLPPLVRRALVIRSLVGSASVKKLKRMHTCVGSDGRARGLLQYHGASPGRWAGRLLQPQNFPRGSIKDSAGEKLRPEIVVPAIMSADASYIAATIGEPIEVVVSALRHAIIAAPHHILLSGDFAQIEARIVLALAGQSDKVALLASGKSPYCDMGQKIYKRPIDKYIDTVEYQISKNAVLGLGFQMGWKKFKSRYAKEESEEFCQTIVETYRKEWAPKVPKVWYALEEAATKAVHTGKPHNAYGVEYKLEDGWLTARLPSDRKLWYFNPHQSRKAMPWDETDVRMAWTYQQTKTGQLKTIDAFGGLVTENVIQALARDLMVHAMFNLEANGYPIILTVHDEIICEVLMEYANEKDFREIMEVRPQWAIDLQIPVAVETWQGDRYRK